MATNEGFNSIVLSHKGLLFAVCRRYARRGLDEEDLMQEVLVALKRGCMIMVNMVMVQVSLPMVAQMITQTSVVNCIII